jgi:hypothetical protein
MRKLAYLTNKQKQTTCGEEKTGIKTNKQNVRLAASQTRASAQITDQYAN